MRARYNVNTLSAHYRLYTRTRYHKMKTYDHQLVCHRQQFQFSHVGILVEVSLYALLFGGMIQASTWYEIFTRKNCFAKFELAGYIMSNLTGGNRKRYKEYLRNPAHSVPERMAARYKQRGSPEMNSN